MIDDAWNFAIGFLPCLEALGGDDGTTKRGDLGCQVP